MNPTGGYWAEITAEGPVHGRDETARIVLAEFESPHLHASAHWLATQALRIANRLDPHPAEPWVPAAALRPVTATVSEAEGDVPTLLRQWANSPGEQRAVVAQLESGDPFAFIAADHTGLYVLALWPVSTPRTPPTPHPRRARHRKPRLRPALHTLRTRAVAVIRSLCESVRPPEYPATHGSR
ncbi:hypothetical protein AB0D49_12115 [Streptomyces sp. NPDC048290]|uniref:hypothetical protein n=1 Tax=Streptomyces sp. NPDC048290 TaxID=3155811 RepID=UPI0034332929